MKPNSPKISIVIPVLNEEQNISKILTYLSANSTSNYIEEILVVDGGSNDNTVSLALDYGATVIYSPKGRAKQLNTGAKFAKGSILYFLHADTFPPKNFDKLIINEVQKRNNVGSFQLKFDTNSTFLNFFGWLTRINLSICRGGDQSLYITKKLFLETDGFNENYIIYEDNEFIRRVYKVSNFTVLPFKVKTSTRRYDEKGKIILQYHFGVIHLKNYLGAGPEKLYDYYKRKIAV
ncbi:TIGR04283 family arsenosugar biosynthesis glycosyltransferase [Cellulophaga sp. E16_2]|uniref:TIGR04283 family arsenosugar biosynthesis glycosyltransferase n=1 Tax=Cellulophaga sp. E16_2 TaxID=2789297 RepID=UPI001A936629|nr:TIGR04283 family arsenosugar biosynthesis glycosyltransferase [Cellulophaga sp. E16_2]MBO0590688.1 TIGR04283 family arsenosugar biosynthesis glycosyltransferase [Cellulophaga sp. E16_2]